MTSVTNPPKTAAGEEEHVETLDEILHEEEADAKAGCGIMGRYPLISVITFAALGLGVGIVSNFVVSCCVPCFRPSLELEAMAS